MRRLLIETAEPLRVALAEYLNQTSFSLSTMGRMMTQGMARAGTPTTLISLFLRRKRRDISLDTAVRIAKVIDYDLNLLKEQV